MRLSSLVKASNLSYYLRKKPTMVGTRTFETQNDKTLTPIVVPDDSGVKSEDLYEKLSEKFNVKHLSDSTKELDEIKGILFGNFHRPFGLMTIKINNKIKNIFVLIDTSSPRTFISEEVLNSCNLTFSNTYRNDVLCVMLNKRQAYVDYFSDLNILGTDYLREYSSQLFVDFEQRNFIIKSNE
ncbi:hypothetical protein RclHR1_04190011 [Rhizophagus clarus]|uniref:Uncharacterized protein n=1 Tax=Rhizophagus clarus TaxID=94130 RepID=A0A2Z6S9W0_9GLOM|nr:hypothetical protein RclHR1_04190011 [Rhizophagus clarus]